MTTWSNDELNKIGAAYEMDIAPRRRDGTLRNPVTIWVVRSGGDLYVRSWLGHGGAWFRAAQQTCKGRITASGVEKDVTFEDVDAADNINDALDAAYQTKYRHSASHVPPMISSQARAATLRLVPA
jgi:hypothetical protein